MDGHGSGSQPGNRRGFDRSQDREVAARRPVRARVPGRRLSAFAVLASVLLLSVIAAGCVERLLKIRTEPPGALVFINGKEAGVTPLDHSFGFYGTVGIVLRRQGYESRHVVKRLDPPWYEYPLVDFVAEFLVPWKLKDHHTVETRLIRIPERLDAEVEEELERRAAAARKQARGRIGESGPPEPEPPATSREHAENGAP